jgi:hypothetical protein
VPGVNNLGDWGRWNFIELRDAFNMEHDYAATIQTLMNGSVDV